MAIMGIRDLKYSFFEPLIARYLAGEIDAEAFCWKWSLAADACCLKAFEISFDQLKRDLPTLPADFNFVVMAVGKLGASELNLSSDIDLFFLFETDRDEFRSVTGEDAAETAARLAIDIIKLLSGVGGAGFCFRVDNDVRPEGKQGAIVHHIDAAVNFYERWGTELERMMLVRARSVAGSMGLGGKFLAAIQPFIYRKNIDMDSLQKIKATKLKVQFEAEKSIKSGTNIKVGEGGIRELEFVVHSLQLTHGAKIPDLRTPGTLKALEVIKKNRLLPERDSDELRNSYLFLRHMENMIQLPGETHTHILPADKNGLEQLAARMRLPPGQMMSEYDKATSIIKSAFKHIFQTDFEKQQMEEAVSTNISSCKSKEEEVDSLPWFKKEETKRIIYMDLEKGLPTEEVSERLSLVAEVVIFEAYKIAQDSLREIYGPPVLGAKKKSLAQLAIVGLGKLGGREIDYGSDLDLMFIYSDDGQTTGPKVISNKEYFTKLSQRIISTITIHTRYGRAYSIDADLRPSGRSGVLVTSIDSFKSYHLTQSALWEKQSLLKARCVAGDPVFQGQIDKTIRDICFNIQITDGTKQSIRDLRARMENEKAEESATRFNIKFGPGGLMDIETIAQYFQLKLGGREKTLQTTNTLRCLQNLVTLQATDKEDLERLAANYLFMRKLLSRIRLFSNHATDFLDTDSKFVDQIAQGMGLQDKSTLINKFLSCRRGTREIYDRNPPLGWD